VYFIFGNLVPMYFKIEISVLLIGILSIGAMGYYNLEKS